MTAVPIIKPSTKCPLRLGSFVVWTLLVLPVVAGAQATSGQAAPASSQTPAQPASADVEIARAMVQTATTTAPPATLSFQNRGIAEFHATVLSRTPAMRAATAERILHDLVNQRRIGRVTTRAVEQIMVVSVGTLDVFGFVPTDGSPLGETLEDTARRSAATLQIALDEAIELRTPRLVALAVGWTLLATALFALLLRLVARGRGALVARTTRMAEQQILKLQVGEVVRASRLPEMLRTAVTLVSVAVGLFLVYSWLTFVLNRFPYSRPWGEALRGFMLERLSRLGLGILAAIPNLFSVLLIVIVTRFAIKLAGLFFDGVEHGRIVAPWLYPETAPTTRRLLTVFLCLFAVAMAYPYLPGSDTDAFKGISVFVGLMVSLGSSGLVNQLMSGLMITYSRALRPGDFVRIGDVEGTVTQLGTLSTKVKTPRREEVTIPNAVLVSTVTTNYSRLHGSEGVFAPTSVTIGYDVPWRQVHALLLLAAERTKGIRRQPAPTVRQTGLRDFAVEYTLLVSVEEPTMRSPVLDALHASIQDAFNEFGVQIMSPAYERDPPDPKIVPREKWFAAPAAPDRQD
jgi:small-conductance mechanosensitive channel